MAPCTRTALVVACCVGLGACVPVSSLAPAPLDGSYVAAMNEAMVESAALSDAGSQRAENAAAAVAGWRRSPTESEDDDQGSSG